MVASPVPPPSPARAGPAVRPSRRALTRGAAWTVPALAVAVAAPAVAASPLDCPPMPIGDAGWVRSTPTGNLDGSPATWNGSTLQMTTNTTNGSAASRLIFTTTIPVTAGTRYDLSFVAQTAKGYAATGCTTVPTQFNLWLGRGTTLQRVISRTSQPDHPDIPPVAPPTDCSGSGPGTSVYGAGGTAGGSTALTTSYTATSSGSLTLEMRFFMEPTTARNNDDWRITPSFTACTETA